MLMVLAAMLWIYAYLPESVFFPDEKTIFTVMPIVLSRGQLFYVFLLVFAGINVVFMLYFNLISREVSKNTRSSNTKDSELRPLYVVWIGVIHIAIQLFLLSIWLHVGLSNIDQSAIYQGSALLIVGPLLLVLALLLLPVLLLFRPEVNA
jgi:hypothetical protein